MRKRCRKPTAGATDPASPATLSAATAAAYRSQSQTTVSSQAAGPGEAYCASRDPRLAWHFFRPVPSKFFHHSSQPARRRISPDSSCTRCACTTFPSRGPVHLKLFCHIERHPPCFHYSAHHPAKHHVRRRRARPGARIPISPFPSVTVLPAAVIAILAGAYMTHSPLD